MWLDNTDTIRRMVDRLVGEPPALVLIAGDFIYHPLGEEGGDPQREAYGSEAVRQAATIIAEVVALVRPLPEAGIPTYAVLGNHDYGMESRRVARLDWLAQDLARGLEQAGVRVLQNQAVALPAPGDQGTPVPPRTAQQALHLVGIGSHYAGYDRVEQAFRRLPDGVPRLVLMHHPETFARIPARAAPLAVAGHTHGGQISLPFTPDWSWMNLLYDDQVHADGWIDDYGAPGNRLYVNRGIGFSAVPVRINAVPEITVVELQGAS
jgi:hypothetical protein